MFVNRSHKFDKKLPRVVLNWKQILEICYYLKIGNHSNMVYSRLSLPQKLLFFSSDSFWLHKAKNIIQWFDLSVCMYVSVYYIYIDMIQKRLNGIYIY